MSQSPRSVDRHILQAYWTAQFQYLRNELERYIRENGMTGSRPIESGPKTKIKKNVHPLWFAVVAVEQLHLPLKLLPAGAFQPWKTMVNESLLKRPDMTRIENAAIEFHSWVQARLDAMDDSHEPTAVNPMSDGLHAPNFLCWGGKRHELPPRIFQLLMRVWQSQSVSIEEIEKDVWSGDPVTDKTIRSTVSKASTELNNAGVPWSLAVKQEHVVVTRSV